MLKDYLLVAIFVFFLFCIFYYIFFPFFFSVYPLFVCMLETEEYAKNNPKKVRDRERLQISKSAVADSVAIVLAVEGVLYCFLMISDYI